jgi:hypothetical protein
LGTIRAETGKAMSRGFILASLAYLVLMLLWVFTDTPETARLGRQDTFRIGVYTYVVACSVIVGLSALRHLFWRWYRKELRLLVWPPMLIVLVIFWLSAKSFFFTDLWLYATGVDRTEWTLTLSLTVFAVAHGLLMSVWVHRRGMDVMTSERE